MTDEAIKVGDRVRVKEPEDYVAVVRDKVRHRVGTVKHTFTPMGRRASLMAKVEFDARRKGSPTWTATFDARALVHVREE